MIRQSILRLIFVSALSRVLARVDSSHIFESSKDKSLHVSPFDLASITNVSSTWSEPLHPDTARPLRNPCVLFRVEARYFSDSAGTFSHHGGHWECKLHHDDRVSSLLMYLSGSIII